MEYDHDIENIYLSVVNDQKTHKLANIFLKCVKCGDFEDQSYNVGKPRNRHRPYQADLRNLAKQAGVFESFENIIDSSNNEERLQTLWLKIADYIDSDFIQLDRSEPKIDSAILFIKENPTFNETKETNMPIINNVTYFKGTDIKTLDGDQLIKAIKDLESEVESLKSIKVISKKITSNIEEITEAINLVVAELDSRTK